MIHSEFMNEEYEHELINFKKNIKERSETLYEKQQEMSKAAIVQIVQWNTWKKKEYGVIICINIFLLISGLDRKRLI